ncbi:RecF/RecN/SMC [Cladochytrium replicatum]|nr:RecF/RecN/SMC [Cladochytrium replicatum]
MGRLLHIEVNNFKSYKGTQIIGPFLNFTSVCGPNGSGKSNLMDAISFVLGVKSAHLRSTHIRDLLYREGANEDDSDDAFDEADTAGAVRMAKKGYVLAVYETSGGKTIKFTRTITASGASEYKINNQTVTYAKYNAALEAENILIKARNFLVFQGDVEAIASQNGKDLTKLIEQISGSLELKAEYERLKAIQDKATESSALNFNKRKGLNLEMKHFQSQKEDAEKFASLEKQKDKAQRTYMLWKLYHIAASRARLESAIGSLIDDRTNYSQALSELDERLKSRKKNLAKAQRTFSVKDRSLKERVKSLEALAPQLAQMDQRVTFIKKKIEKSETARDVALRAVTEQRRKVENQKKDRDELISAFNVYEKSVIQKQSAQGSVKLSSAQLSQYRKIRQEVDAQCVNEKQELAKSRRKLRSLQEAAKREEETLGVVKGQLAGYQSEEKSLSEQASKIIEAVEEVKKEAIDAKKELDNSEVERRRIGQLEREYTEKLNEVQERLNAASTERNESRREMKMKETIGNLKRLFPGVRGRVIDLCKPTQRQYDTAVSVILGKNCDSIIVDSQKIAIECIQYMRDQRIGQATFLPMDTIVSNPPNERYRSLARGARLALDVIQYEQIYERAMTYVCSNAIICDTMDVARHVCYEKQVEVKAVTLDGNIIHKSGLITGGQASGPASAGRRWEDKDVEELRKASENLTTQLESIQKERRRLGSDEVVKANFGRLQSKLARCQEELASSQTRLQGLGTQVRHSREEVKKIERTIAATSAEISLVENKIQHTDGALQRVENSHFASFCASLGIDSIRAYEEQEGTMMSELQERRLDLELRKTRLDNDIEFDETRCSEAQMRVTKAEATLKEEHSNLERLLQEQSELQRERDDAAAIVQGMEDDLNAASEVVEQRKSEVDEVKEERNAASKRVDEASRDITKKEAQIEKVDSERLQLLRRCKLEDIKLPLLKGKLDAIALDELEIRPQLELDTNMQVDDSSGPTATANAILDRIQIDYSSLTSEQRQNGGEEIEGDFEEQIKTISSEMERLAPNLRSVDRMDEVEAKINQTAAQFEQARKEARTAKDQFNAIKDQRRTLFMDAFEHIRDRIDPIYKELTKSKTFPMGGNAYLSLEDEQEPYNDGVKYHAMPPMKRFRDMEQLSGGEKTVAALALLFAIHSFQPSPFFVLDEVDAALDNTNVAKVANYIRRHASEEMQFIVISLKSTFFEKANGLVGIYRDQEERSSQVLTLKLDDVFED